MGGWPKYSRERSRKYTPSARISAAACAVGEFSSCARDHTWATTVIGSGWIQPGGASTLLHARYRDVRRMSSSPCRFSRGQGPPTRRSTPGPPLVRRPPLAKRGQGGGRERSIRYDSVAPTTGVTGWGRGRPGGGVQLQACAESFPEAPARVGRGVTLPRNATGSRVL